jgi:RNA-binding protein
MQVVQVGKQGLSESMIEEIKTMVKRHKIVKVKFLPSAPDRKVNAGKVADLVGAKQKQKVGFVVVLEKKPKK